jgi:polyhydroxybutyrate depolymerase
VFVVGHSLGASFANDVACHSGVRVRAVASVAGGVSGGPCMAGTAALILHHPDDPLVPISEGERVRDAFLIASDLSASEAGPAEEPALARLGCVRSGDPAAAHPVVWCAHDDATAPGGRHDPHTWPDGAAAAIATFFAGLP